MKIKVVPAGPFGTNLYVVINDAQTHCVLVDVPPESAGTVLPFLRANKLALEAILITHGHWDHNGGVAEILNALGNVPAIPVFAHLNGRDFHEHPEKFSAWYQAALPELSSADFPAFKLSRPTNDGDAFTLLGKEWKAFHVPGHCPGSLAFYCADEKILFTGDVLFAGSIGRTDLPGGDFSTLEKSIREKFFTLPRDVRVLPGHGPETTIGAEMQSNPYVCA